jgi:CRISPR/Cas system-associated endonuclease Cas3-HD
MKLSSPPPLIFSPTLTKTNSRAILKHIEEIENEIRLIKNLDLANNDDDDDDDDEFVLSPHAYPEDDIDLEDEIDDTKEDEEKIKDNRESIYEQVDQWVEKCLNTSNTSDNRLHTECVHLSNTIKDYVVCVCSNNDQPTPSTQIMTAFYLSSTPNRITKRTSSFIDQPLKLENTQTELSHLKSNHECPF